MAIQPTNPIIRVAENDTTLPSTGLSNKLEPITSIKTVGFDATTLVSAEELNYILDNFGQWLEYQKTVADSQIAAGDGLDSDAGTIGEGQTLSVDDTVVRTTREIIAGDGLVTGGNLSSNVTVDMGTPSQVGAGSTDTVTADSHTHALSLDTNNISILTGILNHGGTIPLPSGYIESQCKWMVSLNDINPSNTNWDVPENGSYNHLSSDCYTTGRVLTALFTVYNSASSSFIPISANANYIIIGVK